jgi:Na+/glutamate symporter
LILIGKAMEDSFCAGTGISCTVITGATGAIVDLHEINKTKGESSKMYFFMPIIVRMCRK